MPSIGEFIARFGEVYRSYRMTWDSYYPIGKTMAMYQERTAFIQEFGFSVPTAEALDAVAAFSPLVEVGAGSGAWAHLLAARGANVIATDPELEHFPFSVGRYYPIQRLQAKTAVRRWPERNVFCAWPSLRHTWLRQAAKAMLPGRMLIAIREDATADERTWDYLESAFTQIGDGLEIPSWHYCHDRLEIWRKRPRTDGVTPRARHHQAEKEKPT